MATNAPVYSAFVSSEYSYRVPDTNLTDNSPNTAFETVVKFPLLPSGKIFKMRANSFHIEDPANKNDSRGFVPFNDPDKSSNIGPAKVGMIIIEAVSSESPCWKNYSCINGTVNWPSVKRQIIGQFDADNGDNLNSPWTIISAPLATSQFQISLRAANGVDFLVDRTNSDAIAGLDHWTLGLEFMPLTPEEVRTYFPYRNPFFGGNIIVNYEDEIPDADDLDLFDNDTTGTVTLNNAWFRVGKSNAPNNYYNTNELTIHAGRTGGSASLVADLYYVIADDTATDPATAFSGEEVEHTTPAFTIPEDGGTTNVEIDTSGFENWGEANVYVALREEGQSGYTLPSNITIEGETTTDNDEGASSGSKTKFNVSAIGKPYYGNPNWD